MKILPQMDRPAFRPSKLDQKLLAYMRENAGKVPHMTISQLAEACGTGEATVTRFVKKMGYGSLQQFKVALAAELTENSRNFIINRDIDAHESALVTGRKLLEANVSTLERTLAALPEGRATPVEPRPRETAPAFLRGRKRPSGPRGIIPAALRPARRGAVAPRRRIAAGGNVRRVGAGISSASATVSRIARSDALPHTGHSPGSVSNFVRQSEHSDT